MLPTLTPRETLWFSAQLKLPLRDKNKKQKVKNLITEVLIDPHVYFDHHITIELEREALTLELSSLVGS